MSFLPSEEALRYYQACDAALYVWPFTPIDTKGSDVPSECPPPAPAPPVKHQKRRTTANKKERRRTLSINNAFAELRDCIPNVPPDTKLSKIKTLKLATSYIVHLMDILEERKSPERDFGVDLSRKRKRDADSMDFDVPKAKRGRTGWPQHVWALELKQENPPT